jgi:hypothetical protein
MNQHLVVVRPFAAHQKGDVISDAADIASVLASPHADHVVRIPAPKEA